MISSSLKVLTNSGLSFRYDEFSLNSFRFILIAFPFFAALHRRPYDLLNIRGHLLLKSESSCWWLRLHLLFGRRTFNGRRSRANDIGFVSAFRIGQQLSLPNSIAWIPICARRHRKESSHLDRRTWPSIYCYYIDSKIGKLLPLYTSV